MRERLFGPGSVRKRARENPHAVLRPLPDLLVLSVDDALDLVREVEGEDEASEQVPLEEAVSGVTLQPESAPAEPVMVETWSESARARLLSRLPCELLHTMFSHKFGLTWWTDQEVEVLLENLAADGVILDAQGLNKLRALQSLLRAPDNWCSFYTDPNAFMFVCLAFSGRSLNADDFIIPTPVEMAIALEIMAEVRPGELRDEVLYTIASCCLHHRLWVLPSPLVEAQPHLLRISASLGYEIDMTRVEHVRDLAGRYLTGLELSEERGHLLDERSGNDEDDTQALMVAELYLGLMESLISADRQCSDYIDSIEG